MQLILTALVETSDFEADLMHAQGRNDRQSRQIIGAITPAFLSRAGSPDIEECLVMVGRGLPPNLNLLNAAHCL